MKIFGKGRKWLNFGICPHLDRGIFMKNSSTLPDRAFLYNWGIARTADRILLKILSVGLMHI